jgi:DNA-binding MarR family transcriptional regulator
VTPFEQMADIQISDTLGHLMFQICKAHRNKAQQLLGEIGLYPGQEMLIRSLSEKDGQTQTELADGLCIQPATLTKSVDRMEKAGLIERRSIDEDRRVSRVYLTQAGTDLRESIGTVMQVVEEMSFAHLTSDEKILLRRLLLQVYENVK